MSEQNQNIFGSEQTANTTNQNQTPNSDGSFTDLLGSIKNESGEQKYKDVQTALNALRHSQDFIPQLRTENETLKSQLSNLQAEVERLKTIEQSFAQLTSQNQQQATQQPTGITADDVTNLVSQAIAQRETQATQKSNINSVVTKLQEVFGTEAQNHFYGKAQELGMSNEEMNILAAKSPQAVFKILGIDAKPQGSSNIVTKPGVNTEGYQRQPDSLLGRNTKPIILGATTEDLKAERGNAAKLVEELHNQGLSTYDLTDPKVYFKHFGKN